MNWRKIILHTAIPVIFGIASGVVSGWYVGKMNTYTILTVDLKDITTKKKSELIKKFRESDGQANASQELEKEYSQFLATLDKSLDPYLAGKKVIVLRKEAIVDGNYRDITQEISDSVKKRVQHANAK